ncbi:hypothetical protein [Geobacter sp. DSM 9736]|uniref:hypothetical protein n=1 Tax=Geobacter sp. DSM 9736 TaxID=1277350 RepID=UPI0012FE1F45|nr:hypothetical protein [Geobacter sp. DSM 9736]
MKKRILHLPAWLLIFVAASTVWAAPSPRPFAGIGILTISPLNPARAGDPPGIPIYQEPGVARLVTATPTDIPNLAPAVQNRGDTVHVAVNEKRGDWLNIHYDDAGRTGWIFFERSWTFITWPEFLKGRAITVLPGLRKNYYSLLDRNADTGHVGAVINSTIPLRVVKVTDDWCYVITVREGSGWLRWRDRDGRFLISVNPQFDPQKH